MRSNALYLMALAAAPFALASLGCNDFELIDKSDGVDGIDDEDVPDIEVDPVSVDFGDLSVTEGAEATVTVTVTNIGVGDLQIQDVALVDPDGPFTFGAISSVLIPEDGVADFLVTYTPETSADDSGIIEIYSNDPDEPVVQVDLLGTGAAPIIDVSPEEYDFGLPFVGCDSLQPLTISNVGNEPLEVTTFQYNTGSTDLAFDTDEATNGELPWTIEPSGAVDVWVEYYPVDTYSDIAYLMVDSNDPQTPTFMATQSGNAELYGELADVWEQPINGATDILFALDWSCSMYDDLANVESNFGTFITTLAGMDADYHVAVVTADDGCINGSDTYIDNAMSLADQESIFSTMVNGSYGSNTERAFMLIEAALSSSNVNSGGCNEGFYREDATLSTVGVSDEPEQSVNPYTYYVSLFQAMKSDTDDVVMHAIGGDYPTGCGSNQAYTGMYEATVATGGTFLSICATDFGSHLEILAENSTADLSSFELSDIPVPETIEVTVDGITTAAGWSYNEVNNTIDFEDAYIPEGGSTIEADYAIAGDCES